MVYEKKPLAVNVAEYSIYTILFLMFIVTAFIKFCSNQVCDILFKRKKYRKYNNKHKYNNSHTNNFAKHNQYGMTMNIRQQTNNDAVYDFI